MKNIYTFLLSAAILSAGSMSANAQKPITEKNPIKVTAKALNLTTNYTTEQQNAVSRIKINKAPDATSIISEQPEGTLHDGDFRNGFYCYVNYGSVYGGTYFNTVGTYVVADDAIYLKNPLTGLTTNTWLKLDKVNDEKYVAHLPQAVYSQPAQTSDGRDSTAVFSLQRLVLTPTERSFTYVLDSEDGTTDAYFTYKDGVLAYDDSTYNASYSNYPDAVLGLVNGRNSWQGYFDAGIKINPNPYVKTELPEGLTPQTYRLENTNYVYIEYPEYPEYNSGDTATQSSIVDVAVDGNDYYIKNPADTVNVQWIKGSYDAEKNAVVFKPQYIGSSSAYNVHLWFVPATYEALTDSALSYGYIEHYREHYIADELDMNLDAATKTLTSPKGTSFVISAEENAINGLATYDDAKLTPWAEEAAAPADPIITNFTDGYSTDYYSILDFTLPNVDVNGNVMNVDKAYYNVYTSKDLTNPYALTPEEGYFNYSGDPVNIPYTYNDGIDVAASDIYHSLTIYFDPSTVDSIGIQSVYTGGGETNKSNIVWYNLAKNGINSVSGNNAVQASVAYYDLSGRQVASPKQAGIYIKEITFADGTKKGVKIIKK